MSMKMVSMCRKNCRSMISPPLKFPGGFVKGGSHLCAQRCTHNGSKPAIHDIRDDIDLRSSSWQCTFRNKFSCRAIPDWLSCHPAQPRQARGTRDQRLAISLATKRSSVSYAAERNVYDRRSDHTEGAYCLMPTAAVNRSCIQQLCETFLNRRWSP